MRFVALLLVLAVLAPLRAPGQERSYADLKADAERAHAEGSYARARELYERAKAAPHPAGEDRWIDFRLADTLWRSDAATQSSDASKADAARAELERLVAMVKREEDRDRVWVEANESLGDFWWLRRDSRNWGQAWAHYAVALDWWAGAREVDVARRRYLAIVWKAVEPPSAHPWERYGYYGTLPLEILENALTIARDDAERARAHYFIAVTLARTGDPVQGERAPAEFEAAIRAGRQAPFFDDALYEYANFLAGTGRVVYGEDGTWRRVRDYARALELYRRIISEYAKGQTAYYDEAVSAIDRIVKPSVQVVVPNAYLPGAEVEYALQWRNVSRVDLALYRVDLPADTALAAKHQDASRWVHDVSLAGRQPVRTWSRETADKGDHEPGGERLTLAPAVPAGAYLLEARAGDQTSRDVVLVTDASLVVKTTGRQALVFFCGSGEGAPVQSARVALWQSVHVNGEWQWRRMEGTTDADGVALFDLSTTSNYGAILVAAAAGERQAFSYGQRGYHNPTEEQWRIYAYTDRPAYRPGEEAFWKLVARHEVGGQYTTPANREVVYQIDDPRGTKVAEGTSTLNGFGSAWGSLRLTETMPLGEYRVTFWTANRQHHIGGATLLRLEEYKLPEFKVEVRTPEENGQKKAFRVGETVQVDVAAEYYFGGPVANASVEVLVYQTPYHRWWRFPREYPWLYEQEPDRSWYGRGEVVKRETLRTDATGRAKLSFLTPRGAQQDFQYTIEARVTDASRREIVETETVRVTRQRYYVEMKADRNLLRPTDEARVKLKTLDANDRPLAASGTVKITREFYFEVWLDPRGREVSGEELRRLRERSPVWPPAVKPGETAWKLKRAGYERDEISTATIKTDTEGNAEVAFTPAREGYYRVAWHSREAGSPPIEAAATVWAVTNETTELGYRSGGLEILVEKDTFREGQTARVMLAAPSAGRYVLFTTEGDGLYSHQLVRMTGTVKLVEFPIEARHVPNMFLNAAMVADQQLHFSAQEIVVPPVRHFLTVEVKSDREVYEPREEGTLFVTAKDADGRPVEAEVGLGFVDDSVYYIQKDYAGDPRQVFFGQKRQPHYSIQSTFNWKSYKRALTEQERKQLLDGRDDKDGRSGEGFFGGAANESVDAASEFSVRVAGQSAAAPAPPPGVQAAGGALSRVVTEKEEDSNAPAGGQEPAVTVRSDFRSTVLWQPDVVTGPDGTAVVKVRFPDSLTGWRATARAATAADAFGIAESTARTRKPLTVRLQTPRFLVAGDTVTFSAVANNNTDAPITASFALAAEGIELDGAGAATEVTIPARGEHRVDWAARATVAGSAKLTVTARGTHSDAMERVLPVYEHGVDKLVAVSGKARGADTAFAVELPAARKAGTTRLDVTVAPSLAVTMLDAIPYLLDYPYGCTEQTMSRFMPAAVVSKTLVDLGIRPEDIEGRLFGGIEPATAAETHPNGKRPVGKLAEIQRKGLDRLYDFQHDDGGWGWWKDDQSDHYMTAYVVWGLALARQSGVEVRDEVFEKGVAYLEKEIVEAERAVDLQAWMLFALSTARAARGDSIEESERVAFENLYANRDKLNAYTRAMLATAAHHYAFAEQAQVLVRNLENGAKIDRAPNVSRVAPGAGGATRAETMATAHWGEERGWWRWSDGAIEATSFTLRAMMAIDPKHRLVEPTMNWLVKNRRGAQWSNTRDTAFAVLALAEYLKASGELGADLEYEVVVNGASVATRSVTRAEAIAAPNRIAVDAALLRDGANEVRIVRKGGTAPIYFSAEARFFSTEEPVTPAGNELFVRRQYFKLVGRATLLKGYVYDRVPLGDNETIKSGERVEVILTIETKNDYEYLVFEDLKPAGFEAVDIRSGESLYARELRADGNGYTDRTQWVYRELRDRKVACFVSRLPQGVWEIRYDLRAEAPGAFHGLPVVGHAMYVPEIRGNGAETRVRVVE